MVPPQERSGRPVRDSLSATIGGPASLNQALNSVGERRGSWPGWPTGLMRPTGDHGVRGLSNGLGEINAVHVRHMNIQDGESDFWDARVLVPQGRARHPGGTCRVRWRPSWSGAPRMYRFVGLSSTIRNTCPTTSPAESLPWTRLRRRFPCCCKPEGRTCPGMLSTPTSPSIKWVSCFTIAGRVRCRRTVWWWTHPPGENA